MKIKIPFTLTLVLSLVLVEIHTSCQQDNSNGATGNQIVHDLLVKTVSDENIPGIIAAVLDSNGILLTGSAGVRKINSAEEITTGDLFHIGSCTKAMTSALLATLVADGLLKWETTITDVFPEYKDQIHMDYHQVTLHQLVTHRSGIRANAANWGAFSDQEIKERRVSIMKANLEEPALNKDRVFLYSNLGYMIAGSMAERVTGKSWEILLNERIFGPLGMSSAGFGPPGTTDRVDQPWGHNMYGGEWQPSQADNPEAIGPAGTVHCSIEDWGKFISLFLTKGDTKILTREQIVALTEPVVDYACGWGVVEREWANGIALTHSGSNTMWFVTVWVAPELNRAYIAGTNSSNQRSAGVIDGIIGKLIGIDREE